jgi:F1F0 ATPase subunit 2
MSSAWTLIAALIEGILIGFIFFGGLWWTVQKGVSSTHPASLFFGSLFVRTTIAVLGFYFVSLRDWHRMIACLLGFMIARILVTRFSLNRGRPLTRIAEEVDGEPYF